MLEFFGVTLFILLAAMAPGADFAMVVRNSVLYSRRAACLTALGVGASMLVHTSYSLLGLAVLIAQSEALFDLVKYAGAAYLCWLGLHGLLGKGGLVQEQTPDGPLHIGDRTAFRQGFLCNLLNPKAPLFFIAFYSVVVPTDAGLSVRLLYGLECALVVGGWFVFLALAITHRPIKRLLYSAQVPISRALGGTMLFFGIKLALARR
ncbi:MAG: LysE family transporter [Desulfovibrionaceae bacterium]